jgi:hypothetical protein
MPDEKRNHVWISNAAFKKLTGIGKVCMYCGKPKGQEAPSCPGKKV